MNTKICTTCRNEYPATDKYWYKSKYGKYGYSSKCKECIKAHSKEYTSTDKYKKYKREKMKKWRAENPEKIREKNRRYYNKNADRLNAARRHKLKTDPEYARKVKELERKYVESGRRHEMNCKPDAREKARLRAKKRREERRSDPIKKEHDYKLDKQWRAENKEYLNEIRNKKRKELCPNYVAQIMGVSVTDLTPEILETKRLVIQLKRELKNNNVKIR